MLGSDLSIDMDVVIPYAPGVDVVVVNYRTPGDLKEFIESFVKVQFEVPSTLFVVNVEPLEADAKVVEEELDAVKVPIGYAVAPSNVGYARACNMAAAALREIQNPRRTLAFFNADTVLQNGVLDHCHWNLHQNENWGVIGPKQVDEQNRITHAGMFGSNDKVAPRGWHQPDNGQFDELRDDAITVAGSAYFVKRTCWDEMTNCPTYRDIAPDSVGAFLPTPHYYEETWLSYHVREHGWKVAYDGLVSMTHKWHKASPVGGAAEKSYLPKSRKQFREACDAHSIAHD